MNKISQLLLIAFLAVTLSDSRQEPGDINSVDSALHQSIDEAVTNLKSGRKHWKDVIEDGGKLNLPAHLLVN